MPSPHWTNAERKLMRALAVQLRVLSFEQISRGWFPDVAEHEVRNTLDALQTAGLVQENICEIHLPIELDKPILTWQPGDDGPGIDRLASVANKLEQRWSREFTAVVLYSITSMGANQFGSRGGKLSRDEEHTHDYHLSEVFLRHLEQSAETSHRWLGEMAVEKLGFQIKRMKDPDAFLLDDDGKATRVVEFAGRYSPSHLQDLHHHCAGGGYEKAREHGIAEFTVYQPEGTAYELW